MPLTVGFGKNIADKLAIPCWVTNFSQATISGYYGPTYEPTANVLRRGWNKTKKVVESLGFVWANRNGIIQQFAKWRKSVRGLTLHVARRWVREWMSGCDCGFELHPSPLVSRCWSFLTTLSAKSLRRTSQA